MADVYLQSGEEVRAMWQVIPDEYGMHDAGARVLSGECADVRVC